MEEDINLNKAAPASARVLPAVAQSTPRPPPPPSSSSSNPPKDEPSAAEPPVPAGGGRRKRFSVELRAGETTIVSWKKLLKESSQGGGPPSHPRGAEADLGAAVGPSGSVKPAENDLNEELPSNRFSAVIEKIERLYMGKQSSDEEELNDVPDDDQYDTEDSFIDDAELDEYFQVDKLATKHNGYFVNKGKLEQIEPSSSPNVAPRKRRRKETTKSHPENDLSHAPGEQLNVADMRVKAASRNAQFVGKKLSGKDQALHGAHYYEESKIVKSKANAHTGTYEKKSADFSLNENPTYAKVSNKDVASLPLESKDFDKHKAGSAHPRDIAYKSRTSESYDYTYPVSRDKSASSQLDFQSKKLLNSENVDVPTKIRRKEKYRAGEFADTSTSGSIYPMQAVQSTLTGVREGASIRPKGTTLERAIRDLEKIVAEFRPPSLGLDVQEVDPACQVKRRLPQEVKQKLAKVARLSASQGKISEDELIDRLMGILGHLVQRKTLKRNMKEMVELGLSAKQQKADRFQQIKGEINEMIRSRISYIKSKAAEQPDGSAENFQEVANNDERRALKGKYSMDSTLEDKICDLYDLYVEGMDEDKGPQSRKLYVELAELWPHGYMDNVGIKDAIYRSKERRRALYRRHKVRDAERIKRKRLASANKVEDSNQSAQVRAIQERPVIDYSGQVIVSPDKLITNQPLASTGKVVDPSPLLTEPGQYQGSKNIDKVKGGNTITTPDEGNKNVIDVKKKMKRKSESDLGEIQVHPAKVPSQHTMERQKSHKHTDETNASSEPKTSLQVSGPPSSDKPI